MKFSITTPLFNQLAHLRRCVASVADQVGSPCDPVDEYSLMVAEDAQQVNDFQLTANRSIQVHHRVQDGGCSDGTVEFLKEHQQAVSCELSAVSQGAAETPKAECRTPNAYSFSFSAERDDGMYDAINKGTAFVGVGYEVLGIGERASDSGDLAKRFDSVSVLGIGERASGAGRSGSKGSTGESLSKNNQHPTPNAKRQSDDSVVAWLNCDEQYLPGTLKKVSDFFVTNPSVDILFGGMLIVDEAGELLSCRKAMPMRRLFLEASYLYNYSCAMFFRRSAWEKLGGLDTSFKNAGDEELIRRAMKIGLKTAVLDDYLATFTYSGENLSSDPASVKEHERLKYQNPKWVNLFRVPINLLRLGEKFLRGGFVQKTLVEYEIYVGDSPRRTKFRSENSSCRWPDEARPYLMSHRLK